MKLPYISTILILGEYCSTTANTTDNAQSLVEAEFEYITEIDGEKLFKKRK